MKGLRVYVVAGMSGYEHPSPDAADTLFYDAGDSLFEEQGSGGVGYPPSDTEQFRRTVDPDRIWLPQALKAKAEVREKETHYFDTDEQHRGVSRPLGDDGQTRDTVKRGRLDVLLQPALTYGAGMRRMYAR